jgi:hypothetical protein
MRVKRIMHLSIALGIALILAASVVGVTSSQTAGQAVAIDGDDLGGVVIGPNGPEAGVWVIAETTDLPTRFIRIVVTDDQGRYLLPDLPSANYKVWVRGYGLIDSAKVDASPGRNLNLTAVVAPNLRAAAQYYPAGYWFSMLRVPPASEFPGTGEEGNGISTAMGSQAEWLRGIKTGGCYGCHQIGNQATREFHESLSSLDTSLAKWERRIQSGQSGSDMITGFARLGRDRALGIFADWTDRIAAGEVPPAPSRPQGVERNLVVTLWDWADPKSYLHDVVSTDRRNPTVNANGRLYGALEHSSDYIPVLDPMRHTASQIPIAPRDPSTPPAWPPSMPAPSLYYGDEVLWKSTTTVHNPMFDGDGRVWLTAAVRPAENPEFCREGSDHPSAQLFPTTQARRHLAVYDPRTDEYTHISTCFGTHHLMFAEDADNTLWTSGGGEVVGWLNTRMFLETGDEEASQGWTAMILDANGNGMRDAYVEPDDPVDPTMDKRIRAPWYGVAPAPDGSVWASAWQAPFPGAIVRLVPGPNPPHTTLAEFYELPWNNPKVPNVGYSPRGMDIDRDGVVWMALASGHLGSFDRRKCAGPLNGPEATGQHCPEGFAFYAEPLPQLSGVTDPGSAGASYYTWVDQLDTFGLGRNVPINTGNAADALLALKDGQWVVLRVPYPMGFHTKWMDGRIDDPNAGWKGRGMWATIAGRAPYHMETGRGTTSKVLRFQLRPDPLAK